MKQEYEKQGYYFAKGVLKLMVQFLCLLFILSMLLGLIMPTDDSDVNWHKRSGLTIHTDDKTGLQYFSTPNGGITPRLDAEGRQMVNR